MTPTSFPDTWIIDACCVINLVASGQTEAILHTPLNSKSVTYAIADTALNEATVLRRGGGGENSNDHERIDWAVINGSNLILVKTANAEEMDVFVSLASQVDDGEAMTIAIASARGFGVVTDDRKARRFLDGLPCLGTLDLLHNWSLAAQVDEKILVASVRSIRERANFVAPRTHSLSNWWNQLLDKSYK